MRRGHAPQRGKPTARSLRQPLARKVREILSRSRIARLATFSARTGPHAVPICFVYHRGFLYSPLDRKPKRVALGKLARVRNIENDSRVALLIDHYEENWSKLWFLLIRGKAKVWTGFSKRERAAVISALRRKYPQYARGMLSEDPTLIRIVPDRVIYWQAKK